MSIYENFANVYDNFMLETPYDEWVEFIKSIWKKYNITPKLVLDLACGTGTITCMLAKEGIDMIGIDNSANMLEIAGQKAQSQSLNILFLNQDMQNFELYGTVDTIICLCDSINYILEEDELLQVLNLVNNYLDPKGLFIFDINTEYKFKNVLGNNSFCETAEDSAYTWENFYDEDEMINEFYTNFFIKDEQLDLYSRFEEIHYEKAYSVEKIKNLLEKSGLKLLELIDAESFKEYTHESERIFFVAQEMSKFQSMEDNSNE